MSTVPGLFLSALLPLALRGPLAPPLSSAEDTASLRARYLITVADDFIVDVYLNGKAVPDSKRSLLQERFGATAERIDVAVKKGDWLVFHVVNDRLRWGGAYYFAAAGCFHENAFGFVSNLEDGNWSACDTPGDVERFIASRTYFQHRPAQRIAQPWGDGTAYMQQYAGSSWNGAPLWGGSGRSVWVKVQVE
jgi:hypothetical protein